MTIPEHTNWLRDHVDLLSAAIAYRFIGTTEVVLCGYDWSLARQRYEAHFVKAQDDLVVHVADVAGVRVQFVEVAVVGVRS